MDGDSRNMQLHTNEGKQQEPQPTTIRTTTSSTSMDPTSATTQIQRRIEFQLRGNKHRHNVNPAQNDQ